MMRQMSEPRTDILSFSVVLVSVREMQWEQQRTSRYRTDNDDSLGRKPLQGRVGAPDSCGANILTLALGHAAMDPTDPIQSKQKVDCCMIR